VLARSSAFRIEKTADLFFLRLPLHLGHLKRLKISSQSPNKHQEIGSRQLPAQPENALLAQVPLTELSAPWLAGDRAAYPQSR